MTMAPDGYRYERGLLWPLNDLGAADAVFDTADLEFAYEFCRKFDVVVQAGGNCGVWPARMANKFKLVYTFEPDCVNFRCLCANAPAENVLKFNAALGRYHGGVQLHFNPTNVGAHFIDGRGNIPRMLIDDLRLDECDLIYLDIEGYEHSALNGAFETIRRTKPTVVFEDKGLGERYGRPKGETERWMFEAFGYRVAAKRRHDIIMVPRGQGE